MDIGIDRGHLTEAEKDLLRSKIDTWARSTPCLQQYINHISNHGQTARNTLGWHADGERRYAAVLLSRVGLSERITIQKSNGERLPDEMAFVAGMLAATASVYLWSERIIEIASASPLPTHVVGADVMDAPVMFWSQETSMTTSASALIKGANNWMLLIRAPDSIRIFGDVADADGSKISILFGCIPFGWRFPDDFPIEGRPGTKRVLSRLAFLRSPFVSVESHQMPRQWRRDAIRSGQSPAALNQKVHTVLLRRSAQAAVDREVSDRSRHVDWKNQWWVSGHYRAQWMPSSKSHKVIWIAPYLKGPADKPVAATVFKVNR